MNDTETVHEFHVAVVYGLINILPYLSKLQQLTAAAGQPGTMHGLNLLLGSRFARRKLPCLVCFHCSPIAEETSDSLTGAVLLLEYRFWGLPTGIFATADSFGVRTVAGLPALHPALCLQASRFLLRRGARLVLTTCRADLPVPNAARADVLEPNLSTSPGDLRYASNQRTVQDTFVLGASAEDTLHRLGKRTRVHLRAARRRFDREYPQARFEDATQVLAVANDATLQDLNHASLDVIDQAEFNHQVRSVCQSEGGFALGLRLEERWIALIGGWRQGGTTWIDWQCNGRGFEKLSLGSVLRTYLFEEEASRGGEQLSFHGGTSHSMLHRFQHTAVIDLLVRRPGLLITLLVQLAPWVCARLPALLQRGNFLFNALCAPGLRWSALPPITTQAMEHRSTSLL